jgi:hypothetical protein
MLLNFFYNDLEALQYFILKSKISKQIAKYYILYLAYIDSVMKISCFLQ